MANKTIEEIKAEAAVVRDATEEKENTALRVGTVLIDMIDKMSESVSIVELENMIDDLKTSDSWGSSNLEENYWILSGTTAGEGTSGGANWTRLPRINVSAGDKFVISTVGGGYARAWGLTDTTSKIYAVADANIDITNQPATITASQDGYLYVNCKLSDIASFSVDKIVDLISIADDIDRIRDDVTDMQGQINSIEGDISDLDERVTTLEEQDKEGTIVVDEWDSEDLEENYWILSGTTAGKGTAGGANWTCLPRINVSTGDKFVISTVGGGNARAWGLTDTASTIYAVADANIDTTNQPAIITASQDGYLYVNCKLSDIASFSVQQIINVAQAISDINEDIADIEEQIAGIEVDSNPYSPHYKNNPLPLWKDTLKILTIGNSYSDDMMSYVGNLAVAAGISPNKLGMYRTYQGSGSLQNWCENYENGVVLPATDPDRSCVKVYGNINMITTGTLAQILAQDWDIVILHQASKFAADYTSFNPFLTKLIGYIRENCTNQQVCIAWQSVWSYKSGYTSSGITYEDSEARWAEICDATKQMMHNDGIDIIIPTGTAIQNARAFQELNPSFNAGNTGEVTRDGTHLEFGVGRYIAACTFFQTILAPIFGVSVLGNTAVHAITSGEQSSNQNAYGAVEVDDSNRVLCQLLAFAATANKWSITNVTNHAIPDNTSLPMYSSLSQEQINTGADTAGRFISAKLVHDNAYIVEETYSSGSLTANKFYDFETVSANLTVPSLDATSDLVSNALNFYTLRFVAGADGLTVTFTDTNVVVNDTPTINSGDYVEIMINPYVINNVTKYFASISVWPTQ